MKRRDQEKTSRRSREFLSGLEFSRAVPEALGGKNFSYCLSERIINIKALTSPIPFFSWIRRKTRPNFNHFVPSTHQDRSLRSELTSLFFLKCLLTK